MRTVADLSVDETLAQACRKLTGIAVRMPSGERFRVEVVCPRCQRSLILPARPLYPEMAAFRLLRFAWVHGF